MLSFVARDPCLSSKDGKGGDPCLDRRSNTKVRPNLKEPRDLYWRSKNLRSKKRKRIAMEKLLKPRPKIESPQVAVSLRSKKQKSIAMEKLPESRPKTRVPRKFMTQSAMPPRRHLAMKGRPCKDEFLDCIEIALSAFNEKSLSEQGLEYELVEAVDCMPFLVNSVYHCNFIARRKNETEAKNELFFAEVKYVGDGPLCCRLCCILGPSGIETGLSGCKLCEDNPGPIQHPPKGVRFRKK